MGCLPRRVSPLKPFPLGFCCTQALREAEVEVPRWLDGLLLTARAAKPID